MSDGVYIKRTNGDLLLHDLKTDEDIKLSEIVTVEPPQEGYSEGDLIVRDEANDKWNIVRKSSILPNGASPGQFLYWDGASWTPGPSPTSTGQILYWNGSAWQTISQPTIAKQLLLWDGSNWIPSRISTDDLASPFSFNSFNISGAVSSGGVYEVGFQVNAPITASWTYTNAPASVTASLTTSFVTGLNYINVSNLASNISVVTTESNITSPAATAILNQGGTTNITFKTSISPYVAPNVQLQINATLTSSNIIKSYGSSNIYWHSRNYCGYASSAINPTLDQNFIKGLSQSWLRSNFTTDYDKTIMHTEEYNIYYAYPTSYATNPTFKQVVAGLGEPVLNFTKVQNNVEVENSYGIKIVYDIWKSNNAFTSPIILKVVT